MRKILFVVFSFFIAATVFAQTEDAKQMVNYEFKKTRISANEALLTIVATPTANVKLFSIKSKAPKDSSLVSEFVFNETIKNKLNGNIEEEGTFMDTVFVEGSTKLKYSYSNTAITYKQKINLNNTDSFKINGTINYGFLENGQLKFSEQEINEQFNGRKLTIETNTTTTNNVSVSGTSTTNSKNNNNTTETGSNLWWLLFTGIGAGLVALLTPCVYSMLPITVSFFTKKSKTKKEGIQNASVYSLSIIFIFVVLGGGLSALFGPGFLNTVSTHWLANLLFFAVFVIFGVSFLGAFEIKLPYGWANATDGKANHKSYTGIFFMALTLVIVSFSCTGPFIGTLIKLISQPGASRLAPIVGFFGFGFGLAIPFFIFSLMPSALNSLSKSGGWQNALKVTLGILEIAFAFKFLSNVDQQFGWGLLNRDVYIAIWIALFLLLTLYLLGKIKFKHDSGLPKNDFDLPHLSVTRFSFAAASLIFSLYLIPGLFGAPLNAISGFLPPYGTQQFVLGNNSGSSSHSIAGVNPPSKYVDLFKNQHPEAVSKFGLSIYNDYNEALAASKASNKPLFIDFTGINCVNCRKYESTLWSNAEVAKYMRDSFIVASVFTDATSSNYELPEEEFFKSDLLGEKVTTIGQLFKHKQLELDGKLVSPAYIFVNPNGQKIDEGFFYSEQATANTLINYMQGILQKRQK
jgi:thiol:disulfide interchange protein